jgi:hypothetical protein
LSRFDVVAVQEVRGNLKCLRDALKVLGPNWGVILTDVTRGDQGNDERLAFLFDTRRVRPSGLACELVLPEVDTDDGRDATAIRQFARTPYAVSFATGSDTFILVTLHVRYGSQPTDRIGELTALAEWLGGWAKTEPDWGTTFSPSATSTSTAPATRCSRHSPPPDSPPGAVERRPPHDLRRP